MYATNVRNLKKNPSVALREAETSPVLILKGNQPNALLLHLSDSLLETEKSLLPALASSLYKDGTLSLGAAAKLSKMSLSDFIQHLAHLNIDVITHDAINNEVKDLSAWIK